MYTRETTAAYPVVDIQAPLYVVSSVANSDGIGGTYSSDYSYVGAKAHVRGGGFLGFHTTTSTDVQTGITSSTTYGQGFIDGTGHPCPASTQADSAYPYCLFDRGLPLSAEKRTGTGVLLNSVSNKWNFITNPAWNAPQYHVPQLTQSVESSYELAATEQLVSTVTTCNQYDGYGNPTNIAVWSVGISCTAPPAKTGKYVKETVNEYFPVNQTRWYLGRLKKATVTSVTP